MWKIHGNQHKSTISRWFLNHDFGNKNIQSHPTKLSNVVPWFSMVFPWFSPSLQATSRMIRDITSVGLRLFGLRQHRGEQQRRQDTRSWSRWINEAWTRRPDRRPWGNQWYPNSWMVYDVYDGKSHENPMKIPWKMDENGWNYRGSLGVALFQKKKQYEHTVDGRNHAPPWLKPVINRGINHLSTGARFLPFTVSCSTSDLESLEMEVYESIMKFLFFWLICL